MVPAPAGHNFRRPVFVSVTPAQQRLLVPVPASPMMRTPLEPIVLAAPRVSCAPCLSGGLSGRAPARGAGDRARRSSRRTRRHPVSAEQPAGAGRLPAPGGFRDDPALRGLGAGEANIDKVAANRMSKRGMAWTIAGARRLAKVLETTHNRVLTKYVARPPQGRPLRHPLRRFLRTAANAPFLAWVARKRSVTVGRTSPTNAARVPCCAESANRLHSGTKN
jgi:hypothetical protein